MYRRRQSLQRNEVLGDCPAAPEERYNEILNEFNSFDRTKSSPVVPVRKGRLLRTDKTRAMSPRTLEASNKSPGTETPRHSKKSIRSKSTTATTSLSTDLEDSPASNDLAEENKRLKRMLRAMERQTSEESERSAARHGTKSDSDVMGLRKKTKELKTQYKEERRKSMQLGKDLNAHQLEIEGLQRELAESLDKLDDMEKDQASDRTQLLKLTNELEEWRKRDAKTPAVKRLESELRQRNDELEMTLEMLENKVQRILQLENELRLTKRQFQQHHDLGSVLSGGLEGSLSSMDLQESRAECKKLRRQNLMLKLLFEELEESRTPEERQSLDELFQRVALECDESASSKKDAVHVSSEFDHEFHWPIPENLSPVSKCPSVDEPSTDASSARAEALFQKEIERFSGLDGSNSSMNKSRPILHQSPRVYASEGDWINPYDL